MVSTVHPDVVRKKSLRAGTVGNLVEWFDWSVYGFFAPYFERACIRPFTP